MAKQTVTPVVLTERSASTSDLSRCTITAFGSLPLTQLRDVAFQKTANMSNVALAYFGQQLELSVTTINHIKQLDTLIMSQ